MKFPTVFLGALFLFFTASTALQGQQTMPESDVVVYGGTSAAVTAAVQVKKMGGG